MMFRRLKANEIQVRVCRSGFNKAGAWVQLLLYKDARCDMNILNETLGEQNWQRKHESINGDVYCSIGINAACIPALKNGENCADTIFPDNNTTWIWKQDCGEEGSFGTAEGKSRASDSFKRAAFCWTIGLELYSSKKIFVNLVNDEESKREEFTQNPKDERSPIVSARIGFYVSHIAYDDSGKISQLVISDAEGRERYKYGFEIKNVKVA